MYDNTILYIMVHDNTVQYTTVAEATALFYSSLPLTDVYPPATLFASVPYPVPDTCPCPYTPLRPIPTHPTPCSLYPLFPGSNEIDQVNRIHKVLGTPTPEILTKFRSKGTSHISLDFPPQKGIGKCVHVFTKYVHHFGHPLLPFFFVV